jgi:hypothetical protein
MSHKLRKTTKFFPLRKVQPLLDQKGQSFIEFVLLMLMVIGLSYGYMRIVNGNLGKKWSSMVTVIVNDSYEKKDRGEAKLR